MAVNLRKGLSEDYTLLIYDVNKDALSKFQKEMEGKGPIEVVENGLEAVKKAVSLFSFRSVHGSMSLLLPCRKTVQ